MALSTLLGHDDHPGEIPGLGPVPASHARAVVADQRRAEWRYAITDTDGRLLFDGLTRRRPTGLAATGPRGGIVELHIPAALLAELTSDARTAEPAVARWAGVLADIARQYGDRDQRDLDAHPGDRLPRAALRRHTQIRDRTCVGIGCRHRPPAATRTTPSSTRTAARPSPPTWHRCAVTTTPSRGRPAGPSNSRHRARSSGSVRSAGGTRSSPNPSCRHSPTPVPGRTIPGTTKGKKGALWREPRS